MDQHFGPGTAERFIQLLPTLDWKEQFVVLHDMVRAYPLQIDMR